MRTSIRRSRGGQLLSNMYYVCITYNASVSEDHQEEVKCGVEEAAIEDGFIRMDNLNSPASMPILHWMNDYQIYFVVKRRPHL